MRSPALLALGWLAAIAATAVACRSPAARIDDFRTGRSTTKATDALGRGMNFGDAVEAPNEGDWGWTIASSDFKVVREAGFDHVRVPMKFSAHTGGPPAYKVDARFFRRVDWVIDQALSNDLGVIVDVHHFDGMMQAPLAYQERLVAIWQQIATRYHGLPRGVVFEVLNEPTNKLTAELWNPILTRVIAAIRAIEPDRTLIVEGVHWASAKDLRDTLQVPEGDKHLVGSFHMYAPMFFTHQGFGWMPSHYNTRGVTFPGPPPQPITPTPEAAAAEESREFFERYNKEPVDTNPGGPAAIREVMDMAKAWADRTGLPVYMGEFGAGVNADRASRARWTETAVAEAKKRGFGWGYWDYCRNFGVYSSYGLGGSWIPEVKAALLQ